MSVNEAPSFTSIPEVIEESEIWVRGPLSKLPPLTEPVPSDWEVVEGYCNRLYKIITINMLDKSFIYN